MDPSTGTFTSMDTYSGSLSDPVSLHKYLFANANPVMYSDPSGHFSLIEMDAVTAINYIIDSASISGMLYIIDAQITDPNHEYHDFFGYMGAIGFGMLFAALSLALSATVIGLLILAVIDTILGVTGAIKGVIDMLNGHPIYGGLEIASGILLSWFGWKNYANARGAANAVRNAGDRGKVSNNKGQDVGNSKKEIGNGLHYSVMYEADTGNGGSRTAHRNAANRQFYNQLKNDQSFRSSVNEYFGYDVMKYMESGRDALKNPSPDWVWHHPYNNGEVIQLIPKIQHTNPILQPILHPGPNRSGGYMRNYRRH